MIPSSNKKVLEIHICIHTVHVVVYRLSYGVTPGIIKKQENDKNLGKVTAAHHITYTDYFLVQNGGVTQRG